LPRQSPHSGDTHLATKIGLCVSVAVLVLAVCWPVLSARALSLDDGQYLTENQLVQNPSLAGARRFLFEVLEPSTVGGYYQPLSMISLMLDAALGGGPDNLRPFHRSSLALHAGNTVLVLGLLFLLFRQVWPAALLALLYGLHPLAVEPLAWIAERKTLLGTFFALWSLVLYVRYAQKRSRPLYVLAFGFYVLGLMSKPTTIPVPVLFLLLDYWPIRRLSWRAILEKIPFLLAGGIFVLITLASQRNTASVVMPAESTPGTIPLTLCYNIAFYFYKTFLPTNMSSLYLAPEPFSLANPVVLAGVVGTCLLALVLLLSVRWSPALLAGCVFFFLAIFPTLGIVGFQGVIAADRHAYLPVLGLLLPPACLLAYIWGKSAQSRPARRARVVAILVVLGLALGETIATRQHLAHWGDTEGLFRYMLTVSPQSHQAHNSLANSLVAQGRIDEAHQHYVAALEIEPDYFRGRANFASLLIDTGDLAGAVEHYQAALRLRPDASEAHFGLGDALVGLGRTDEGMAHYYEALRLKPDRSSTHYNLANALARHGRPSEAIDHYRQTLRLDPNHYKAHHNLGLQLTKAGRFAEAIDHFHAVLRLYPAFTATYGNLGYDLRRLGRYDEAVHFYRLGVQASPNDANMHVGLAICFEDQGRLDEAAAAYRRGLQLDAQNAEARRRLDRLVGTPPGAVRPDTRDLP
jgi:tetratricopeptide (TPR) repeat protein